MSTTAPLCRFGVIADVQYADIDDRRSFDGRYLRRYRGALAALRLAVAEWTGTCDFVMDLGDIIDQQNDADGTVGRAISSVMDAFDALPVPHYHLVGNHELYCFTRAQMATAIPGITGKGGGFSHAFSPATGWRVIVLDGYDEHVIADKEVPKNVEASYKLLEKHNPNDVRAPRGTVNWCKGLRGVGMRFVPFNGGIGSDLMAWFAGEVADLTAQGERGIVCCHLPVHPAAASPECMLWNYQAVLDVVHSGNVVAWLSGHDHIGGSTTDEHGVHHVTFVSPLHATEDLPTAHAVVELHDDAFRVVGSGVQPSINFPLDPLRAS